MSFLRRVIHMIVLKFGGSALCDAVSFILCAQKIVNTAAPYTIVVSAMRGVTKMLLELILQGQSADPRPLIEHHERILRFMGEQQPAFKIKIPILQGVLHQSENLIRDHLKSCPNSPQHQAEILSQGEWLSAQIMVELVSSIGVEIALLDPRQFLRTQGGPLCAQVVISETLHRIMALREHPHAQFLIPGFFGGNHASSQTTLLGSNSSDYSGALFAIGLGAFGYEIWKDIDGIYESDPKISQTAQMRKYLTYKELMEKSNDFSQVIHPAVAPLLEPAGIPIFIKSIFHPGRSGTIIADQQFSFSSKER